MNNVYNFRDPSDIFREFFGRPSGSSIFVHNVSAFAAGCGGASVRSRSVFSCGRSFFLVGGGCCRGGIF